MQGTMQECDACGERHECQPTPVFRPGRGAMLCDACYHLNITLSEGPDRWLVDDGGE